MISVENLTKYYGNTLAIADVTFEVRLGEILGFLGPNGAGKTTTMRILGGFLPATSGTAKVAGYDVFTQSLDVRKRIGYLPETVPLYPEMTVYAYLDFMAKLKGLNSKQRRRRISEVMEQVHIGEVSNTTIAKLSKGYRQRVGLAQALVHDPAVLILDEPTVGLDPRQIIETRQLIKGLAGERTVILSTHILPEVSMTCNRVVIINDGRVVAVDTPENLTQRLRGSEHVALEVRGPSAEVNRALQALPGVLRVESEGEQRYVVECSVDSHVVEQIAATIVGNGWGLRQLQPLGMSLEEIFLRLTTTEEVTVQ